MVTRWRTVPQPSRLLYWTVGDDLDFLCACRIVDRDSFRMLWSTDPNRNLEWGNVIGRRTRRWNIYEFQLFRRSEGRVYGKEGVKTSRSIFSTRVDVNKSRPEKTSRRAIVRTFYRLN